MTSLSTAARPPYAEPDDAATMRGDCRVASVRMGLVDPRDRRAHDRGPARAAGRRTPSVDPEATHLAAHLAARLGL